MWINFTGSEEELNKDRTIKTVDLLDIKMEEKMTDTKWKYSGRELIWSWELCGYFMYTDFQP